MITGRQENTSVMVRLLADGQVVAGSGVTLSKANNWTHTWNALDEKEKMDRPSTTQLRRLQL